MLQFNTVETHNFETFYAQILKIYHVFSIHDSTHYLFLEVNYFFSKQDLDESYLQDLEHISGHELFKTDLIDHVSFNAIVGKFKIVSFTEYQESLEDVELKYVLAELNIKSGKLKPALTTRPKICLCKKIENPDFKYIQCDLCKEWHHLQCTGLPLDFNISNFQYKCKKCITN